MSDFGLLILGDKIDTLIARVNALSALVQTLVRQGATMASDLTALQAAIANETTVIQSAIVGFQGLAQEIQDLKNDPVALQALADQVNKDAAALAAAVPANTPTPTPTPPAGP
jgi:hypothetical protein